MGWLLQTGNEYVQLLMLMRLWRVVRIAYAIVEMQSHVNAVPHA